jgi:acetoin utilization deacetylase AcuC-like enzyme
MKIIYSDAHESFAPRSIRVDGEPRPARDIPERVLTIKRAIERRRDCRFAAPEPIGPTALLRLHREDYVAFLRRLCESTPPGHESFPTVWPPPAPSFVSPRRLPTYPRMAMGYYLWGTDTPVTRSAYDAALAAAGCALAAAGLLLDGERCAYSLSRPPGHHAGKASGGGLCFFNNTALAAAALARRGLVAVLDIDYHHGNGTQALFYRSARVLTLSIHADPSIAFPFFTGFADEQGAGRGKGCNLNEEDERG